MLITALALYAVGLIADLTGAYLAVDDLRKRLTLLRDFHTATAQSFWPAPTIGLTGPIEWKAQQQPGQTALELHSKLNNIIESMTAERNAREETDRELARLGGVGANLGRLKLGVGLLIAGAVIGGTGNIVGQLAG